MSAKAVTGFQVSLALAGLLMTFGLLLFVPAGRMDWPAGWLYVVLMTATTMINYMYLRRNNPELIAHRMRIGKGTKRWDMVWLASFTPLLMSVYIVAGLEAGNSETLSLSLTWWLFGFVLFAIGMALVTWSMGENPFFEKTVRIQVERAHRVIDSGPYAMVRHPGYTGFLGWISATPLLLGSWWSIVPALLCVLAVVVRTHLEDMTLKGELKGYTDYSNRVGYRLIPGVW